MPEINSMKEERDSNYRFYRRAAIASAVYRVTSVYLLFAGVKAIFQNDTRYFDIGIVIAVVVGTLVYGFGCAIYSKPSIGSTRACRPMQLYKVLRSDWGEPLSPLGGSKKT